VSEALESRATEDALAQEGHSEALATARRGSGLAHAAFFAAVLGALVWAYDYASVAELGPVSIHSWRQGDGASLALSYYENGMRFFEPRVHNVAGGEGRAVGEFPALYYAVAGLYQLFGPNDALFRVLNFAVLATGLFLFSRALRRFVADPWLVLVPPFLLLASPLIAFYAFNFLPNTTALGLVLSAAYLYVRFVESGRLGWFYAVTAVMVLAALIKISTAVPLLALLGAGLALQALSRTDSWVGRVPRWPHLLASAAAVLGLCAAWYAWAHRYNEVNAAHLFLLDPRPLWALSADRIAEIAAFLFRQRRMYFDLAGLVFLAVLTVFLLARTRRLPELVALVLWLTLLGSGAFLVLFFGQLHGHHYYFIDIMPLAALVLALGVWTLDRSLGSGLDRWAVRIGLALLVVANVDRAAFRMSRYYALGSDRIPPPYVSLNKRAELAQFLEDFGIAKPDRVLVLGDEAPNTPLYYLDLPGWTRARRNLGPRGLAKYAARGARYLVVLASPRRTRTGGSPFPTARPIAVFDGRVQFFELTPPGEVERPRSRITYR
jgi:4-amino-4-deoxy-L-arabinose transferase-like glycosyltransferase